MRLAGKIQPDNRKFSGDSTREIKTIAPCRAPILRPIWRYRPSKVSRAIYEGGRNQTRTGYRRRYILYVREAVRLFRVGSLQRRYAITFIRRKRYIDYPEFSTTQ